MRACLAALLVLVAWIGSVAAEAVFDLPGLARDAARLEADLAKDRPPQPDAARIEAASAAATAALAAGDVGAGERALRAAIAAGDDRSGTWLSLGIAQKTLGTQQALTGAVAAMYTAYRRAETRRDRQMALEHLGDLLTGTLDRPKQGLRAYRAARDLLPATMRSRLDQRIADLLTRIHLTVDRVDVESELERPQACLRFSDPLTDDPSVRLGDYLAITPTVDVTIEARDDRLCLTGIAHGTRYMLTLREGLPGRDGLRLAAAETVPLAVGDRAPSAAFRSGGHILARGARGGIPLTTINLDSVLISVLRLNDRRLADELNDGTLLRSLYGYRMRQITQQSGERIWQGLMAVGGARNHAVTTGLPLRDILPDPKPGLYAVVAEPADVPDGFVPWRKATQWVMVSDLGLTSFRGADGITVFARSFARATPVPGLTVRLIARNNTILGTAPTDAMGRVRFDPGLARGTGGNTPLAIMAYGADGDFAMLDLSRAAFDLSDRGVGGRTTPGPMDAFVYSDRGVYRPGETAHLTALLRDDAARAVGRFPLHIKVLRPSGTEAVARVLPTDAAGGAVLSVPLTDTAPLGTWTALAFADPKAEPVGRLHFQVEDFVPERLTVAIETAETILTPGTLFPATVVAHFLYGPPAAGLGASASVAVGADPNAYPDWAGYRFGLEDDTVTVRRHELTVPVTDATGRTALPVTLPDLPDTTLPLRATVEVAVNEPGGRPTRQRLTIPVRHQPFAIGVKPAFDGNRIAENSQADFDIAVLDRNGAATANTDLTYALVAERRDYQWYLEDGRYNFRVVRFDADLETGTLETPVGAPRRLTLGPLPYGRYRLEVAAPRTGVATSVRFTAGWWVEPQADDTPDRVQVVAQRETYRPGETATVRITPPFAGEALVTVATDRLHHTHLVSVPAEGIDVSVPVAADWGPGAYVVASVVRPPVEDQDRLPVRAIGLTWLGLDTTPRRLTVDLDLPEVVSPRRTLHVPVRVTQTDTGDPAATQTHITLAAVDEGILQLTDFASPRPGRHYFGKRSLGLDLRDDYGRLIDTVTDRLGPLRQGGDTGGGTAALPVVPFRIVSLFQGPVPVDPSGTATVALDVPDFNGRLRVMAVAYGPDRLGAAAAPVTVRDALVSQLTLPRFLAPGDVSQLTASLHNVDAPEGRFTIQPTTSGPVHLDETLTTLTLARDDRRSMTLPLKATGAGIGHIALTLEGPDGLSITRDVAITVRPARPVETLFTVRALEPGGVDTLDADALAGFMPGTGHLSVQVGTTPPMDVAGLLAALDRFPYGCLEQTVSRAFPLLTGSALERALGLGDDEAAEEALTDAPQTERPLNVDSRVDRAIGQVLDKQRFDGAFGLWSARSAAEPWLTAYALDFLTRAQSAGRAVPSAPLAAGTDWMRRFAVDGPTDPASLAARAYGLSMLARTGRLSAAPIRYFYQAFFDRLPTPLARGQVAAALAHSGFADEAHWAFDQAIERLARDDWHRDYGSTVRDAAALTVLLAETGHLDTWATTLLDRLPMAEAAVARTNTQEQAWLVQAAAAFLDRAPAGLTLRAGGAPVSDPTGMVRLVPARAALETGFAIENTGSTALWHAVSVHGVPAEPRPAVREGLSIRRYFFNRDGTPLNLDTVAQNDVFVMVLEGGADTGLFHQAIVVHPMPAGWEIENATLGAEGTGSLGWLKTLTTSRTTEARDDRYVAAVDLDAERPSFRLAFLVRAVTPGSYELPGAHIEDLYKPRFVARQRVGRIQVLPAIIP